VNYGSTAEDPDTVVFMSTNDGFLHAVDADTGAEAWAYVPARLLARQHELYVNGRTDTRRYGLDGEMRLFTGRLRDDGPVQKILVFGMGRGGDAVFALDVTERNAPRLLWQIDSDTEDFGSIGQTWAAPVVTRIEAAERQRPVVVLSGGYDDSQDNRGFQEDTVGNAIYVVDLESGARLWSAGTADAGHDLALADMRHSIPAAPRVLDLSGDGLADRLYVGDMGGRIWRFDFTNGEPPASFGKAHVLASLGAADITDPAPADVRRFYATPDVVFVNCESGNYLAVNIGSGYRGHPLDTDVADAFFSVRDPNLFGPFDEEAREGPTGIADLTDITDLTDAEVPADSAGWMLRMVEDPGEKILAGAVTFDNSIFFQSYAPDSSVSACAGGLGTNRSYIVNACNGSPVNNLNDPTGLGPLTLEDRSTTLNVAGIAPETAFLFTGPPGEAPTRCVGLLCFPPDAAGTGLNRTYWMQEAGR
jgi:type IV pilus assembly protein PilY1